MSNPTGGALAAYEKGKGEHPLVEAVEAGAQAIRAIANSNPSLYCILAHSDEVTTGTTEWLARAVLEAALPVLRQHSEPVAVEQGTSSMANAIEAVVNDGCGLGRATIARILRVGLAELRPATQAAGGDEGMVDRIKRLNDARHADNASLRMGLGVPDRTDRAIDELLAAIQQGGSHDQ